MLSPEQTREIHRLLTENRLSHRAIALRTGASRGSVAGLAARRWAQENGDDRPGQGRSERVCFPPTLPDLRRCPDCGGLVVLPCRTCMARQRARHFPLTRLFDAIRGEPLGLKLNPKHAARYERVHRRMLKRLERELDRELRERENRPPRRRRRIVDVSVLFARQFRRDPRTALAAIAQAAE